MKRNVIILALALACAGANAQNLNPTVEVTNTYVREAGGIEKPAQLLHVPDSVKHFNLNFDYSVMNTPYMGAYEFKPYLVQLRPMARPSGENTLFVRVGAGWTLNPEASIIWTPVKTRKFRLNFYADHNSYWGQYRNINLTDYVFTAEGCHSTRGGDSRTIAGANMLLGWSGGSFTADLHYRNIFADSPIPTMAGTCTNNSAHFNARVQGNPDAPFVYSVGTSVSYLGAGEFDELHSFTDGSFAALIGRHNLGLDIGTETVTNYGNTAVDLALTPRYILDIGGLHMHLGVKFSYIFRSDDAFYASKSDFIFPDVHIHYNAIPKSLILQMAVTGGDYLNHYSDLLETNHFLHAFDGVMDNSVERVNVMLGVRGNIVERFRYDLKLGYAHWKNAFLWSYLGGGKPGYGYADKYNQFYTDLQLGYLSSYLDVDSRLLLRINDIDAPGLFQPSVFSGQLNALYNWGDRIKAGITVEGQTDRLAVKDAEKGTYYTLPGYVDLGLYGSLQMTGNLGFWLKVGNLLNQTVQRVPLYAEKGIYFTVGATWNL